MNAIIQVYTIALASSGGYVRINKQYRIIFAFENGDAYDVTISDYH